MTENVDIIVSRYNENLQWINEYPFNQFQYIIYNKGTNDNFCKNNVKQIINLKNVGRNDHTYLYHIINNYSNLSNILVFFPGSINISEKKKKAKNLLNYILLTKCKHAFFLGQCPNTVLTTFYNFKLDHWKASDIQNSSLNPENDLHLCQLRPYYKWYNYFFGNTIVKWHTFWGIFSIDKRDIIQHTVIRYQILLNTLSGHSNPEAGHYIERSWGAIFYPLIYTKKIKY